MFKPLKEFFSGKAKEYKVGRAIYQTVGEIIMVVAGILIAFAVDNWSDSLKQEAKLKSIYSLLVEDIVDDTTDIAEAINEYESRQMLFVRKIAKDMTREELQACDSCHTMLYEYPIINIEKRGYEALAEFNAENSDDTLRVQVVQFYAIFIKVVEQYETQIKNDIEENTKFWRDNYKWYADVYLENYTNDYLEYIMNDPDYRNRLTYHYSLVYDDFVPALEVAHEELMEILSLIKVRIED